VDLRVSIFIFLVANLYDLLSTRLAHGDPHPISTCVESSTQKIYESIYCYAGPGAAESRPVHILLFLSLRDPPRTEGGFARKR
ncbi:hypothetical protein DFH29DRAFT_965901, partial [Suillus ampliporus]